MRSALISSLFILFTGLGGLFADQPEITGIYAFYHQGQVFVQWREKPGKSWYEVNVYASNKQIQNVDADGVRSLARRIIPLSGRDYLALKKKNYKRGEIGKLNPKDPGMPLPHGGSSSPLGGLFVHTVSKSEKLYFAITISIEGKENKSLQAGESASTTGIDVKVAKPMPYQVAGTRDRFPETVTRPSLGLHAIGGVIDRKFARRLGSNRTKAYMLWLPKSMGWREGLPAFFAVRVKKDQEIVEIWPDDGNFAFTGFINTWWYGYNEHILDPKKMSKGKVYPYTHRKLCLILDHCYRMFPFLEPKELTGAGSSMGGTGLLNFALKHPKRFASLWPNVAAGDFTKLEGAKTSIAVLYGPRDQVIQTHDGKNLWQQLSNIYLIENAKEDLPFIKLSHGRHDKWMVWEYSLGLYEALNKTRQPHAAFWTPMGHGQVRNWVSHSFTHSHDDLRSDRSYPAIFDSTCIDHRGNGDPHNGDPYGGINTYLSWKLLKDNENVYSAKVRSLNDKESYFGLRVRREQNFRVEAGDKLKVTIRLSHIKKPDEREILVPESGVVEVEKVGPVIIGESAVVTFTRLAEVSRVD